jgi:AcrR family transcriptional regulator
MARRSQDQPSGLSRERILEVALDLAGDEGIDALSMRRLAQELDVWPMSVYRYFQDKDALLDAMAADLIEQVPDLPSEAPWRERMQALLEAAVERLARSPGLAARLPRAFLGERALRLPEAGIAILLDAGFDPSEAASAWRALWSYTFGFATFRAGPARSGRAAVDAFAGVVAPDAEFASGLAPLLDGLALRAGLSRA